MGPSFYPAFLFAGFLIFFRQLPVTKWAMYLTQVSCGWHCNSGCWGNFQSRENSIFCLASDWFLTNWLLNIQNVALEKKPFLVWEWFECTMNQLRSSPQHCITSKYIWKMCEAKWDWQNWQFKLLSAVFPIFWELLRSRPCCPGCRTRNFTGNYRDITKQYHSQGAVSWLLTHYCFCQVTSMSNTSQAPCSTALLYQFYWWLFMKLLQQCSSWNEAHSLTFWHWSHTPCTTQVCMADKDSLTAKWITHTKDTVTAMKDQEENCYHFLCTCC